MLAFRHSLCQAAYDTRRKVHAMFIFRRLHPPPRVTHLALLALASSNDRQVLQRSPEVLRISLWLESAVGHYVSYTFVSIPPVGAVVLAVANRPEAAVRLITFQVLVLAPMLSASFLVLGKSLLKGIDESLQRQQRRSQQLQSMGVVLDHEKEPSTRSSGRSSGDLMLLAARKKVKKVVMFTVALPTQTASMLLFATVSRYGAEAPLVFFFFPMTFTPPIWNIFNVTIHQGRTQLSRLSSGGVSRYTRTRMSSLSSTFSWRRRSSQPRRVVPTETSTAVLRPT